jgi:DNA excision repair protein ERCC-2
MALFPYDFRDRQSEIMETLRETLESGKHLVMESPTGTGKTICALAPCLEWAFENGKRIFYITRTNSQQLQVLKELRAISKKHPEHEIFGIGIQGRANMCPLVSERPGWKEGSAEELSKLCRDLKDAVRAGRPDSGCRYFAGLLGSEAGTAVEYIRGSLPTIEDLVARCVDLGVCPYELVKSLMKSAHVVVMPYIFVFHPFIRERLLAWTGTDLSNVVLIVDEAHNLPEYIREMRSVELGQITLDRASAEGHHFGNVEIVDGLSMSRFCSILEEIILDIRKNYIVDEDGLVPDDALETGLLSTLSVTSPKLKNIIDKLMVQGEIIIEARRKTGQLPRSYIGAVASFLARWMGLEGEPYIRLIKRDRKQTKLEAYCLDPTVAGEVFKECAATIHMSGTLAPLSEYRDSVGLPHGDTTCVAFKNPFPPENRLVLCREDLTTQYEALQKKPEILQEVFNALVDLCNNIERNTIIFFPSFEIMQKAINRGVVHEIGRKIFIEEQGEQEHLMRTVKSFKQAAMQPGGAVLFSVAGGRVSEGMDFPEKELELAVLVGIPYPKPSAKLKALTFYYDRRFKKGWEYIVKAPTTRKILQTLGRLIRSADDAGVAMILDRRAVQFRKEIPDLKETDSGMEHIINFFEKKGK